MNYQLRVPASLHCSLPSCTHHSEKDALQDGSPPIAEVLELVALHVAHLDETFANKLEDDDARHDKHDEDNEEDVAGHENVGELNLGAKANTIDTANDNSVRAVAVVAVVVGTFQHLLVESPHAALEKLINKLERPLLNLNRLGRQVRQNLRRSASSRALVPSGNRLQETESDNTHAPLEVLSPGSYDRRKRHSGHADKGLRLEVAEESHGVGGNVRSSVGVTESGSNGRRYESQARDDSDSPRDTLLVHCFTVGEFSLDTGLSLARSGAVDVHLDRGI